jgi:type IV pilus assembly protein PilY1
MNTTIRHTRKTRNLGKGFTSALVAAVWTMAVGLPAAADDTELLVADSGPRNGNAQPNVLIILDTSTSMAAELITQETYDPARIYAGTCDSSRVYWRLDSGEPSTCGTDQWFNQSAFVCAQAQNAFALGTGFFTDRMSQYDPGDADQWRRLDQSTRTELVECEADRGVHGDGSGGPAVYAQNGDDRNPWSDREVDEIGWGQNPADRTYTVFDGNYLNWFYGPTTVSTRIQVMKDVTNNVLNTTNNINVGLMRFRGEDGGRVTHAVEDIFSARSSMVDAVNALRPIDHTTLSETLYEAGQYFAGRALDYGGLDGAPFSIPSSRSPTNRRLYKSPIEMGCQKNHIVLLTDGEPSTIFDGGADDRITSLPGFSTIIGPSCDGTGDGPCLDDMAAYLFNADLDPNLPGKQNVITHTIGFTIDLPFLATTAARGGGSYITADDTSSLSAALTNVVTSLVSTQTSFTAPTLSVNSFNRTQSLNDLYLTVFEASGNAHWPGNVKKYRLDPADGTILDANGNPAIDPQTNNFDSDAQSFWSASADGAEIRAGGAANLIPDPAGRDIFTYLGNALLTDSSNRLSRVNNNLGITELGIGNPGDPSRDDLIDFIRGVDVTDIDLDGDSNEPRKQMGDPLHASPVSVIYGGSVASPDVNDAVLYVATNDGYVHAIDAATGIEQWAFVPPEFLSDQLLLFKNDPVSDKHYGVDGNLQLQVFANNNGVIEPGIGEKVYLFFGMRRGGAIYYALDVTNPAAPRMMWNLDSTDLADLGQTWSTPVPTRINIQGATQNTDKLVLAFSGGYDPSQDSDNGSTDSSGNAIYIVDSVSGNLLWHTSSSASDLDLAKMQYSIPADLKVIDLDNDRFADRIYASDMGGQIWRFDVFNAQPATSLMHGGVIAQLGGAPSATPAITDNRRFYYAPDIALVNDDNNSFLHIGIGSGHRAHPNGTVNRDRFYALRDYNTFNARTQADYDTATPVSDDDLVDITSDVNAVVPIGSAGWRFELRDGGWRGEKVLAEARTFNNQVFFTTFTPNTVALANPCEPSLGSNRIYALNIFNGAPVNNLDGIGDDLELTLTDRYQEFQGSIASEPVLIFPSPDDPNCVGDQCSPEPLICVDLFCAAAGFTNDPVRTFWSQEGLQ